MRLVPILAFLAAGPFAAGGNAPSLRLEDVLRAAVSKAKMEDARLDLARNTLKFLDTQNRLRVEFRPSISLFAFSNPALLATSLGGGLLFNRRTAPGFAAMDGARFDALAAEVNAETLRVRVQIDAARCYFELLEKQEIAKLAAAMLETRKRGGADVARLLEASRITSVDALSYEQELLDLEWQWLGAETDRKSASARLGLLIGARDPSSEMTVEDVELRAAAADEGVPPMDSLMQLALAHRGESRLMRDKVNGLRGKPAAGKRVHLEMASAGYAYINNSSGIANAAAGGILGGNTGRGELTLSIPLRSNGERAAHDAVTTARIRLLELEISAMEDAVRMEVTALRDAAASSLERQRLAGRRFEAARKSARIVEARAESGLAPLHSSWAAGQAALAAESAYARAVCERKASLYALLVACGVERE